MTDHTGAIPADNRTAAMLIKRPDRSCWLTVNGGSSSLKFALFPPDAGDRPRPLISGRIQRIGLPGSQATLAEPGGAAPESHPVDAPDLEAAANWLIDWLESHVGRAAIAGIAHRVVHGGMHYLRPERITPEVVAELRRISPMDPDHLPGEIALIERFGRRLPDVPQVACFDTAFHHDLPRVARIVPIPRRYEAAGVRRYGFHGLSYAYLMEELERLDGPKAAFSRIVLAHLGSGASMAAVRHGRPVDTTMGLTPAAGLVMGTRSGDLDPGLPGFLARTEGLTPEQFDALVNRQSGLLGISETSPDLRDLLERRDQDVRASEAVDVFVYQARKALGALAVALGGLDFLVFSGGIGENAPEVRARICGGLGFLGISLDEARNAAGADRISDDEARVVVRVIRTDEESMMARYAAQVLATAP
jgi:acetate kinase